MRGLILFFVIVSLVSCKAQNTIPKQSPQQDADIELIDQDGYSGILEYETIVIKDAKSLNKFYSKINRTRKPGLPVPIVDFSKNMIVVVCMGEQKGEKLPVLSKAETSEDELVITIEIADSHKNKASPEIITYPFYLYKTPITSKPVSFQKLGF